MNFFLSKSGKEIRKWLKKSFTDRKLLTKIFLSLWITKFGKYVTYWWWLSYANYLITDKISRFFSVTIFRNYGFFRAPIWRNVLLFRDHLSKFKIFFRDRFIYLGDLLMKVTNIFHETSVLILVIFFSRSDWQNSWFFFLFGRIV